MRALTYQQRMFVMHYAGDDQRSAGEAARRAGIDNPETKGAALVERREIQAALAAGGDKPCISSDEVLARVADTACADLLEFVDVDKRGMPRVNLSRARSRGLGHLLRRVRTNKDGAVSLEVEPRLPALAKLGEHYKLWNGEGHQQLTLVAVAKSLRDKYEQIRAEGRLDFPERVT